MAGKWNLRWGRVNAGLLRIAGGLAAPAAEALVAANEDYEVTVKEARETLGIEVYE